MNQAELVQEIAAQCQTTKKDATKILKAIIDIIQRTVAEGDTVTLVGFGTFKSKIVAAHPGRNPSSGESIVVPEKTFPIFKPGTQFKKVVNGEID